ncbi:hypothetical protein PHMEG_0008205 [Phytophthora megakarya]|uniref:Uncharacterized protein n=1 Tax=Phytophthora megakarya TaxID=4795 RepID=A0A225WLC6_9STRA|nr:hypothetical protein PHMEG_0008205 [Phytophthora megakarya]
MTRTKAASPTAKSKKKAAMTASKTREASVTIEQKVVQSEVVQESRPASPTQLTKKRVVRWPKYHEKISFLERESFKGLAPTDGLPPPSVWYPGTTLGESYRVASTMFQAAHQASQETRPVSWGYGCTDGSLGHNNTRRVVEMKRLACFRRAVIRAVSAGNKLSLFLTADNRVLQSGRLFLKQDGCNMWKPVEVKFEDEESGIKIVAVEAGHLAAYALDGDGEVFTWGDARYGKTCRADGRTTYVPWIVDLPSNIPNSSFITQLSVGSHHSLAQLRINGVVDRWRKFPLGGVTPAMSYEEDSTKVSLCQCTSSQTTTQSVLGVFVQCETCKTSQLCRMCSRKCHKGHILRPVAFGRGINRVCSCSEHTMSSGNPCYFTSKLAIIQEVTERHEECLSQHLSQQSMK